MLFEKLFHRGSRYAKRFAFLLRCAACGAVFGEIGKDAYTAGRVVDEKNRCGERCPSCGECRWDKERRIEQS